MLEGLKQFEGILFVSWSLAAGAKTVGGQTHRFSREAAGR
jgi:hypothetical protein